jgi:uncharacterized membrane protein
MKTGAMTERLFRVAVVLKGIDGGVQLIVGVLLLVIPTSVITDVAHVIITRDLLGPPDGWWAVHLQTAAEHFGDVRGFAVLYLLLHGLIKVCLVFALLRKVRPLYPVAVVVFAVFIVYELVRAAHTHSIALVVFAALDVVVVVLVVREYLLLRRERADHS